MRSISQSPGKRSVNAAASFRRALPALPPVLLLALVALPAPAQITVDTHTGTITNGTTTVGTVDRRYQQIQPTHVDLPKIDLNAKTRLELIRLLQAEQGFAMRPFPRGHKGLTLEANGGVEPYGEGWLQMVTAEGMSAKPGDRLLITDIKIESSKIVLLLNGGPDRKHRFLRHITIGVGAATAPAVRDDGQEPVGARLTLAFKGHVPELTGAQVKALLAPLVSFDVKTPIQAFTDTLPPKLKQAILDHQVWVGMNTDMVLFARGQPERKVREMDGQMPFEEWIYGKPPEEVDFVRINGNRVIRVEVAKVGEPPKIFEKDEVEGLMRTDGTPIFTNDTKTRTIAEGDVERNPDTQSPAAPPTLRRPGDVPEAKTTDDRVGTMRPVQFPKEKPAPQPGQNPDEETGQPAQAPPPDATQPAPSPNPSQPAPQTPAPPPQPK